MSPAIVPIVEGQAEVEAVPVLLRRVLESVNACHVRIARPFRVKRNRIVKPGELERAVRLAVADRENVGAVLVLLDADDDCPARLAPQLAKRGQRETSKPLAVVLAQREFEAWFLGAKESLRNHRGIRSDAVPPSNPESIRGAKEELSRNMEGRRYLAVDDQPALAAEMDLDAAQKACSSFDRFVDQVTRLVRHMPDTNTRHST